MNEAEKLLNEITIANMLNRLGGEGEGMEVNGGYVVQPSAALNTQIQRPQGPGGTASSPTTQPNDRNAGNEQK